MRIQVQRDNGAVKAQAQGESQAVLAWTGEYAKGDVIVFDELETNTFYQLKVDDSIEESFVYITKESVTWPIPFYEKKANRNPLSFLGGRHYLSIRKAKEYEIQCFKNLALNPADEHDLEGVYPHATANVETRGEAVFAAQNAIDGCIASLSHGEWPYQSWGINRQADAALTIDFGRPVDLTEISLYLRADIPHDSWWVEVPVTFSDGTTEILHTKEPDGQPQSFQVQKKGITSLTLHDLKKHEDESPFPALTQMEVYGTEHA